jgi:hypothetical protein
MPSPILKHFECKHLSFSDRPIAKPFADLAGIMDSLLPDGPEKSAGLRKLLESLDCMIRAATNP